MTRAHLPATVFPFLFGGTFIEGKCPESGTLICRDFPSFSEGLSLRVYSKGGLVAHVF